MSAPVLGWAYLALVTAAVLAPVVFGARHRRAAVVPCAALSVLGGLLGGLAWSGARASVEVPVALGAALRFSPDRAGGLFMVVVSVVGLLATLFLASSRAPGLSRAGWSAWAVFLAGMQLVPAAADVVSFLLAWEAMTLASVVLVATAHRTRAPVPAAVAWYAGMSQLSFFLVLAGFAVLAAAAGTTSFDGLARTAPGSGPSALALVLLLAGFAAKAELVPLHVWVPRVLPNVPAPVAAGMSGAMVNLGVYGALLAMVRLMPGGPGWWGILAMLLGGASAVYGILQASVNSGLKALLAYSTTENMGLVFLALGASVLLRSSGAPGPADAALLAALLLVLSHALFKCTLFLGAGAIEDCAGSTDLDRLGGLLGRMPWTAAAFGAAALAAAALPVTSGFVAEWTLLQSLIHGARPGAGQVAASVAMPLAVAAVALTAGLALMTFVKAYGIAFLARPRSAGAAAAREVRPGMRVPLVLGAAAVLAVGLLPGPVAEALGAALPLGDVRSVGLGGLGVPGIGVVLDPAALALLAAAVLVPALAGLWLLSRRHGARRTALPWGGGGSRAQPRMQYTATSYAEPLLRVFDDTLRPSRDVQVTHLGESRYLLERVQVDQRLADVVEARLYRPVLAQVDRLGKAARKAQNGSIHRYLAYSFGALLAVLVAVAL